MKKKNNKYLIGIYLIICWVLPLNSNSQSIQTVKDSVYILLLKGELDNKQPISSYAVIKSVEDLSGLHDINNMDTFLCVLSKNSVLFEEPVFTLSRNRDLYGFPNEKKGNSFLSKLSKKVDELNNRYNQVTTRIFDNKKNIQISFVKVSGEFWSIPKKEEDLNDNSHSFSINAGCYGKSYIYNLKDIDCSCKLSENEIGLIKKSIQ